MSLTASCYAGNLCGGSSQAGILPVPIRVLAAALACCGLVAGRPSPASCPRAAPPPQALIAEVRGRSHGGLALESPQRLSAAEHPGPTTGDPPLRAAPGRPTRPCLQSVSTQLNGEGWLQAGELGLALVLSALIGLEREVRRKHAGLRTHTLVGVGAALFMLISKYGFTDVLQPRLVVLDPSRVAAQIVTGVGFLGAGLIFVGVTQYVASPRPRRSGSPPRSGRQQAPDCRCSRSWPLASTPWWPWPSRW